MLLALLAAGLLRPEAWLLSAAYVCWLAAGGERGRRLVLFAVTAAAGPVVWALSDLTVTGDALHSLHGTRDLAERLQRPRGIGTAHDAVVPSLRTVVGDLPLIAAVVALAVLAALARRRGAPLLAAIALGMVAFLAIAAAGLSVLLRYLLIPACLLMVAAAGGLVVAARRANATPRWRRRVDRRALLGDRTRSPCSPWRWAARARCPDDGGTP